MSSTTNTVVKFVAFQALSSATGIPGLSMVYNSRLGNGEGGVVVLNKSGRSIRAKVSSNSWIGWAITDWFDISPDGSEDWGRAPRNGEIEVVIEKNGREHMIRVTPFVLITVTNDNIFVSSN